MFTFNSVSCFPTVWHGQTYFIFHVHEVSWVIVYLEALASDAVDVWQQRDALGFHTTVYLVLQVVFSNTAFVPALCSYCHKLRDHLIHHCVKGSSSLPSVVTVSS